MGQPLSLPVGRLRRPATQHSWAAFRPARKRKERLVETRTDPYFRRLPQLGPEERTELFDRLQAGTRWSADFVIMIGLENSEATLLDRAQRIGRTERPIDFEPIPSF